MESWKEGREGGRTDGRTGEERAAERTKERREERKRGSEAFVRSLPPYPIYPTPPPSLPPSPACPTNLRPSEDSESEADNEWVRKNRTSRREGAT